MRNFKFLEVFFFNICKELIISVFNFYGSETHGVGSCEDRNHFVLVRLVVD